MKKYFILLTLALMTFISCDKENPIPEPTQGQDFTISVEMPNQLDAGIKLVWQAGDQLTVTRGGENQVFTLNGGEGTPSATFNGKVPGGTGNYTVTYGTTDVNEQAQTVDASTAHLKGHIRMEAATASLTDNISLKMVSSIMTFVLSGLPADAGILQHLTWAAEGASQTKLCHLNLAGCVLMNGKLTAYLAFVPTEMSIKQGGKLTVTLTGSKKVFQAVMTIADGMTYTAGKQYTTSLNGTNTPWQMMTSSMAFTVRVDDAHGLGFNIPFPQSGITPADITVDWGDKSTPTVVTSGTTLTRNDGFNHTYAVAGEYQIIITSDQADATKLQIPEFNFDNNRKGAWNCLKLIGMDTPMLKTGATSFKSCFLNCDELESIPAGLFDKNTQVTSFESCFIGCKLKSIPAGLFDKNTQVTDFRGCFLDCDELKSIPAGLFDKNTQVTHFDDCFGFCDELESIPAGLFDKNTQVTDFKDCFGVCISLTNIPVGLFDKNTQVTNFDGCFWYCTSLANIPAGLFDKNTLVTSFDGCFGNCSKLENIPAGLFDKNTQVTSFDGCFVDCTSLALNPKIFSLGEDRANRFSGKEMNFEDCFLNVGSALTDASGSIAPDLWNYTIGGATWTTKKCYTGCKATNTAATDVPVAWGGSGKSGAR